VLHEGGRLVSGSDLRENARTRSLRAAGIPVYCGHDPAHLGSSEAVVFSSAVPSDNVELKEAQRAKLKVLHRQELLAQLISAQRAIGVAGTHGKTTTCAMIAALLLKSGYDPTFLVGAPSPTLGGHAHRGRGPWLITEIDESDGYFTRLAPEIAVVTNVGCDHLNYYKSEEALLRGFARFVSHSRRVVLSADDPHTPALRAHAREIWTFGLERPADLVARSVEAHRLNTRADLYFRGERIGELELPAPGRHNVANALAALLVGHLLGLDFDQMRYVLKGFRLPERRFQILEENGLIVVDDYAHLPEQIEANLIAIRDGWRPKRIISVFQPHRYSRMSYMNGRFGRALALADLIVITEIYPAFEPPIPGVDARSVVEAVRRHHPEVHYLRRPEEVYAFLSERASVGDFIIGFGPGDIWQVLHRLVREG